MHQFYLLIVKLQHSTIPAVQFYPCLRDETAPRVELSDRYCTKAKNFQERIVDKLCLRFEYRQILESKRKKLGWGTIAIGM